MSRQFARAVFTALILFALSPDLVHAGAPASKPNIVFILADDLGYGELGCYGQKKIRTPNLDRMAAEGMRFTQFYAGSTVCAPSRCVLMTGRHTGRCTVRGNAGAGNLAPQTLRPEDVTIAETLKSAGYTTGLVGKWGLGDGVDSPGHPNRQGFDLFLGYLNQQHAHNHFPDFLWRDTERIALPNVIKPVGTTGAGYATQRVKYAGDLFNEEALAFVERNRARPFFLYLSVVVPHANNERTRELRDGQEVPDYGEYAATDWSPPTKGQAAMITRLDADVGRLLEKLRALKLDNTLVLFSSDNGPHREGGHDHEFFDPNGPLRGYKRDLTDGGIRVPMLAWWPRRIKPGVSGHVGYFGDVLPTLTELAGAPAPNGHDGISFAPTLLGRGTQAKHESLYWEFHEGGFSQAVLLDGRWKGIRLRRLDAPIQVYDLQNDLGEARDLAGTNSEVTARLAELLKSKREESALWPIREAARAAAAPSAELVSLRKLWDQAPHSAFTDLVRFRGQWFCVFREGQGHVSPEAAVRVLRSADGMQWSSAARIEWTGYDLRDPKIVVTPDQQRLMIVGGATIREGTKPATFSQSFVSFSPDGVAWTRPQLVGAVDRWLWRVTWQGGKAFGVDYDVSPAVRSVRRYTTSLLVSDDGTKFTTLVPRMNPGDGTTEATLRFTADGTAFCLQRRDGPQNSALLGRSAAPYTEWQWTDLGVYFGGPNFLQLADGRWLACGRLMVNEGGKSVAKTVLCALDTARPALTPLLTLPSGGDTSYPGLVWHEGTLWISYYSSHEGKTCIYLAQVRIK